ncbi:alkyl/aryl-sulfatase [Aestuariibacter salexigens]|uniref:alkyl/aryl-sulfatase n=1 Tax=Aestuariibacter salexigens TaxID=226010 RepID=UPI000423A404|nr:alkyl sulfatase dimerization domain-containing protein [Aestuariibacter salexigens]
MPVFRAITSISTAVVIFVLFGCNKPVTIEHGADANGHVAPTAATVSAQQQVLDALPFEDTSDFVNARKGLIAQDKHLVVEGTHGNHIWNMDAYGFIDQDGETPPGSVNPSLWRQAALNNIHGLFEVSPGLYQLRGFDLANMSIISGETGWIIVDPLTAKETAARAFTFAQQHLGTKPVVAIIYTHSHIDHFGGVKGIIDNLPAEQRQALRIIAPEGFEHEATSENVIAGIAMGRRAQYMYGQRLNASERGKVGSGLGKSPAFGQFSFATPTDVIGQDNLNLTVDGVEFQFQVVSGSEAPAEFTFYLPRFKAFCGAELVSRTMHNLYTLRGTKVRDARIWSGFIDEAMHRFDDANVYFGSHHWPVWGQDNVQEFLQQQRDTYKFIHDQTVRLLNQGYTPNEIADTLTLPASLRQQFHNQGYYGTVAHNAKAVYQFYQGWYTGNPAKLHPLPERDAAIRYVEMMGGIDSLLERALSQFLQASEGSPDEASRTYRWLAELLNHAVFAKPENQDAKALLAKVYDQLGYQAESGPWRNVYLSAAYELRHGGPETGIGPAVMKDILLNTDVSQFFDSMAVRVNANDAEGEQLTLLVTFADIERSYLLTLDNSVLHHRLVNEEEVKKVESDVRLALTVPLFVDIIVGHASVKDLLLSDELQVETGALDLIKFVSLLDKPTGMFNIVTP